MQLNSPGGIKPFSPVNPASSALRKTRTSLRQILTRLSTAQRINRASDDAAGLAISEQLRTQTRGFKMAGRNVSDARSALTIAEGAGNEISSMVQRQRELALQARNDTLTDDQRAALDTEYQQLTQEITRTAEATQFNTQQVATGDELAAGDAQIQAGPNAGDTVNMPAIDMRADQLAIEGTSIATAADAQNALPALDNALSRLNAQRTDAGAMVNRLDSTQNNLQVARINTQAAESVLRDQDMAKGLSDLVRTRLLQESGTQAFARYTAISANHLSALL
jgi:flagellin